MAWLALEMDATKQKERNIELKGTSLTTQIAQYKNHQTSKLLSSWPIMLSKV